MRTPKIVVSVLAILLAGWIAVMAPVRATLEAQTASKGAPAKLSPDAMDKLLGPIALYPDQLLSQILLCASDPAKLATLGEWLHSNQNLKGTALQEAAMKSGFDASFVAIVVFPQVLDMMLGQPDWVRQLGQAFTTDRSNVFASIQRLRSQAQKMGTLKTTPQQEVTTQTTSGGEQVIVIQPANEQVVYVPQYNPQVVYTQPATTTVVVQEDDDSGAAVAAGLIGFTAGIAMGAAMDNDYYYGPYGYRGGGFYMYNDAWDDYYDHREDAREDWADHREDLYEERGEQRENLANERTERTEARSETRPQSQAERTERTQTRQTERTDRQANRPPEAQAQAQAAAQERSAARGASEQARGYSSGLVRAKPQRSGTGSGAMSGYSSGTSERAASSRGQSSRSGSRSGGGGGGRRR
jgi:hypothetical protein